MKKMIFSLLILCSLFSVVSCAEEEEEQIPSEHWTDMEIEQGLEEEEQESE